MVYILLGDSNFDYEIRNIIFGIFTDEKMAEQKKTELENIQKENGNDEMILYVISKELNSKKKGFVLGKYWQSSLFFSS